MDFNGVKNSAAPTRMAGEASNVSQQLQGVYAEMSSLGASAKALTLALKELQFPPSPGPGASAQQITQWQQQMAAVQKKIAEINDELNRIAESFKKASEKANELMNKMPEAQRRDNDRARRIQEEAQKIQQSFSDIRKIEEGIADKQENRHLYKVKERTMDLPKAILAVPLHIAQLLHIGAAPGGSPLAKNAVTGRNIGAAGAGFPASGEPDGTTGA